MNSLFAQWLDSVFSHPDLLGASIIAAKTAVIYLFVIAGIRFLSTRALGQMSIYDLVLIVVIANSVQNAMLGHDSTLVGGIVAALTLLVLNRIFTTVLVRSARIERWIVGEPVLILRNGQLLWGPMRRIGVTKEHVLAAMREHGIDRLEDVQMAILEVDGSISIVPKEAPVHRTQRHFRGLRIQ